MASSFHFDDQTILKGEGGFKSFELTTLFSMLKLPHHIRHLEILFNDLFLNRVFGARTPWSNQGTPAPVSYSQSHPTLSFYPRGPTCSCLILANSSTPCGLAMRLLWSASGERGQRASMAIISCQTLLTPWPKVEITGRRTRNLSQGGIQRESQIAHKIFPQSVKR